MSSTSALIENILNVFINSGNRKISLHDLQSQLEMTSTPVNLRELNEILRCLKPLFTFIHIGVDLGVSVEISLKACPSYHSRGCPNNDCPYLHICEKQLKSTNGCKGSCRLLHSFDLTEIKTKLVKDRFDYNLLMNFYQTFYVPNSSSTASAACNSDECKANLLEENCPIEHRRVMVKFSETFAYLHDQKFLLELFESKEKTGGGIIEDFEYKPNEQKAIITFHQKSTAERLLNKQEKRDVHCDGFMFTVTRVNEQKSTSDYISSRTRSAGASKSSISRSIYQKSSK